VKYDRLTAVLVKALQEQQSQIDDWQRAMRSSKRGWRAGGAAGIIAVGCKRGEP